MKNRRNALSVGIQAALAGVVLSALTLGQAQADTTLRGRLTDASGNLGMEGALVSIKEANLQTTSNRDGRFTLPGLSAGDYTLVIQYIGAETQEHRVHLEDDITLVKNFSIGEVDGSMEQVLVIGQAASLNKALNKQRASDSIVSVVNTDSIGEYPDANTSEALQRLPGVSIENDQGEGRFVRVRGLGPNFNSVTINGSNVPSPNSGERAVALDVVPSELLESLEVTKTLTPDMDADAIGGSINVKSLSAFDRDGLFYKASAETNYDEHTAQASPKLAFAGSNIFSVGADENFGVAGAISWYERDFGSDNVESGGNWKFSDPARLEKFQQREYNITRKRFGASLNFDFKATDHTDFYLRSLYSEYSDTENRQARAFKLSQIQLDDSGDPILDEDGELDVKKGLPEGEDGGAEIGRELKHRKEIQKIRSFVLGGTSEWQTWTLNYRLGLSQSSEVTPYFIDGAAFVAEFDEGISYDASKRILATLPAAVYDDANYALDEIETNSQLTDDKEQNIQFDLEKRLSLGSLPATIKFGGKMSKREKTSDESVWVFDDFDENGFSEEQLLLSAYSGPALDYEHGNLGLGIDSGRIWQALAPLNKDNFFEEVDSAVADFDIHEDRSAAYLMATIDINRLRILTGLRYEKTAFQAAGMAYDEYEVDGEDVENLYAQEFSNDYHHTLPSLHFRYQLSEKTQLRAAWTNAVVRPTFDELNPGKVREDDEVEFGNPLLKPLEASNIDIGIEHYAGFASYFSAFLFSKDIDNFVYAIDLGPTADPALVGPGEISAANTYKNGKSASLTGLELAATKKFAELPAPWNGFLLSTNGTWTRSEAAIDYLDDDVFASRELAMPSQSDFAGNVALGYEVERFSARLALNYKSEYLLELTDPADEMGDVWVDQQLSLDFLLRCNLNDQTQIYFQAVNLGDEPYYTYIGEKRYNAQFEDYGPSYRLGISFSKF